MALNPQETQQLEQSRLVRELVGHKGWQQVLKPLLESRIKNSWLDPRKAKDEKDLSFQYTVAWALAQATTELVGLIEEYVSAADYLEKKDRGEIVDKFKIGR